VERSLQSLPSPFAFTVVASDQGNPPRSAKAIVIVTTGELKRHKIAETLIYNQ